MTNRNLGRRPPVRSAVETGIEGMWFLRPLLTRMAGDIRDGDNQNVLTRTQIISAQQLRLFYAQIPLILPDEAQLAERLRIRLRQGGHL